MRTELFMYFILRNTSGHRVKLVDNKKNIFTPPPTSAHRIPVVYATDRSKAVIPVLFVFCVALWFIIGGASCSKVFPCSLSSCFLIPFSIVITSHLFVLYVLVSVIFLFLLVSEAGCGL